MLGYCNALSIARPFQEVFEQLVAFGLGQCPGAGLGGLSGVLLQLGRLLPLASEHLRAKISERGLGAVEAFPAPDSGEEIGVMPSRVAGWKQIATVAGAAPLSPGLLGATAATTAVAVTPVLATPAAASPNVPVPIAG